MNESETRTVLCAIREADSFTIHDLAEITGINPNVIRIWVKHNLETFNPIASVQTRNDLPCPDKRLVFRKTNDANRFIDELLSHPKGDPRLSSEWSIFLFTLMTETERLTSTDISDGEIQNIRTRTTFARTIVEMLQANKIEIPELVAALLEKLEKRLQEI